MTKSVVRDLTPQELEHAKFLARKAGIFNTFALKCLALAENGWLTRGQYDALKKTNHKSLFDHSHSRFRKRYSKRPVSLARSAAEPHA